MRDGILKFVAAIPFPPGFSRFPEVKIFFILVFLVQVHFFCLYFLLGNIGSVLVQDINECSLSTLSDYTLPSLYYGLTWSLAPIPGFLADRYWGRQKVISGCFLLSFIGTGILLILESTRLTFTQSHCGYVITVYSLAYLMLALGSSGLLVVMIPYGVDQIEGASELTLSRYFYWYVWFEYAARISIYGEYMYYSNQYHSISQSVLILGNGIFAVFALFIAICIFKAARTMDMLVKVAPILNPLKLIYNVIKNAYFTRKLSDPALKMYSSYEWMDYSMIDLGGRFSFEHVNSVKVLFNMIPTMVFLIWIFSLCNEFPYDLFIAQGVQLDYTGTYIGTPQIISYAVTGVTILVIIPILGIPWISKKMRKLLPSILIRLFFGACLLVTAYILASIIEIIRVADCEKSGIKNISIAVQVPQYILTGIGTVFVLVNSFEFVYAQSPLIMKGTIFGVFSFMHGAGSLLPSVLYEILSQPGYEESGYQCNKTILAVYQTDMLNQCKGKCMMSYVSLVLISGLSIIHLVTFRFVIYKYKRRRRNNEVKHIGFSSKNFLSPMINN